MIDGIGFDLDGTLWDAVAQVRDGYNEVRRAEGLPLFTYEAVRGIMGKQFPEVARQLNPDMPEPAVYEHHQRCVESEHAWMQTHRGVPYPGVFEVLAELKKRYKLFVVSNCQEGYVPLFLTLPEAEGLFCDYEEAGRTGLSKGENIALVCQRQGIEHPVYLGDTAGDMAAAEAAGARFFHAAYGFGAVPEGTPAIRDISELPNKLKEME